MANTYGYLPGKNRVTQAHCQMYYFFLMAKTYSAKPAMSQNTPPGIKPYLIVSLTTVRGSKAI
jgi:hypothetical protein